MSNPWSDIYKEIRKPYLEGLDPVGKEDGDVNNDGKKDSSDSYLMKRRKAIAKAMGKEDKMKDKKVKNEHHQKDADGNPIDHGDGTPSNVDEMITLTKGDYGSRNVVGSAYNTAAKKKFDPKIYKAGGGLGKNFLPLVNSYEPAKVNKPNYSNWREDFVWDDNVDEAAKGKRLDVKENGVKNKIEINPDDGLKEEKKKLIEKDVYLPSDSGRTEMGIPKGLSKEKEKRKDKPLTGPVYHSSSYDQQGDVISELDVKNVGRNIKDFIRNFGSGMKVIGDAIKNPNTGINPNTRKALELNKQLNNSYIPQDEMIEAKDDKKKKGVKGIAKELDKAVAMHKSQAKRLRAADVSEAKYERGASDYGKASIRNKRMFGRKGESPDPMTGKKITKDATRGDLIDVRRDRHAARRGVKKGNKYHEAGKYRPEVHGVNKPEQERKGKNMT